MIVLGIDPGLASTGYGVVAGRGGRLTVLDAGVIATQPELAHERRLVAIRARVAELLTDHGCEAIALEELYFGQNVRSAFAVGHARGAAMLAGGELCRPCFSYTPQQVKAAVCGNGRAGKDQVMRMVRALLALDRDPRPDHAADALAVAICHVNTVPFARALREATGAR